MKECRANARGGTTSIAGAGSGKQSGPYAGALYGLSTWYTEIGRLDEAMRLLDEARALAVGLGGEDGYLTGPKIGVDNRTSQLGDKFFAGVALNLATDSPSGHMLVYRAYYRQLAKYTQAAKFFQPVSLSIRNRGSRSAEEVRLVFERRVQPGDGRRRLSES